MAVKLALTTVISLLLFTSLFIMASSRERGGATSMSDSPLSQSGSNKDVHPNICTSSEESTDRVKQKRSRCIPVQTGPNPLPPSAVSEEVSVLSSENLPNDTRYMPEVGNGHIATVVQSDTIFINGLYNGANISSHRARIPSPSGYSINATKPDNLTRTYKLDMGRGLFIESYTGAGVSITLRTYAHRELTSVLVTELVLERSDVSTPVEVTVHRAYPTPSEDVDFSDDVLGTQHGKTREAEYPELAPRTDFYMFRTASLEGKHTMTSGVETQSFMAATVINVDRNTVLAEWDLALMAFEDKVLLTNHVREWTRVWNCGRIDMEGNITLSKINYACLYYILSSLPFNGTTPSWPFIGLSPGGLAHGEKGEDYNGHVFWDQDTWMFPPIALLYPDLGRTLVQTRIKTLKAAKLLAERTGYDGARYPWESAYTGLETCPAYQYGTHEIHINGDVPMMFRQYWQLTHDQDLMSRGSGAEVVWETAKFWVSRATYQPEDDSYRILDVMPPDEWHFPVNDSAYTNNIAALTLKFANSLKRALGQPENATWTKVSDKLHLPYDPKLDYHPEFDRFQVADVTKQADVVLLPFPLMVEMNDSTRANDLTIYERSTPVGPAPAMTWGMFSLGWLDLGNTTKAAELYTRSILNVQQPFLVWSENSDGTGATNFQTGMGGYLQTVLFGYGGIRLHDDGMTFNPKLINSTTKMTFTGISYQGGSLDIQYTADNLTLTLTSVRPGFPGLQAKFSATQQWQLLIAGQPIRAKVQSFEIRRKQ